MQGNTMDKDIRSPDIYTHHDNAILGEHILKAVHKQQRLSPNLKFDNSTGRDYSMYRISDLSNLDHKSNF